MNEDMMVLYCLISAGLYFALMYFLIKNATGRDKILKAAKRQSRYLRAMAKKSGVEESELKDIDYAVEKAVG